MNAQHIPVVVADDHTDDRVIVSSGRDGARVRPHINPINFARRTLERWPKVLAKLAE